MDPVRHITCFILAILIVSCADMIVTPNDANKNMEDFEALWQRVDKVYPFLDFKKINWDSVYTVYYPRVAAAKGDEFYPILNDLLSVLKDGHIYYKTDGGGQVYPFYPQRYYRDRHAYSPFVVRSYFNGELIVTESKSAEYGILPANIGYVFLSDFQENYLALEFPGILDYLKNTTGLIIDIRQKRGGSFGNVEAVVTRFMSEPMDMPEYYRLGEPVDLPQFQPQGPFTYTNPVVVIVNGSTFSAGEWTTEILKQLPTVTVIGDTTGGGGVASSNASAETIGEYTLPSGKVVYIGTEYMKRYDGQPLEWLGVPPDIRVLQTEEDIKQGRDKQLEYAISMLK
jgi:hypothetical protein